MEDASETTLSFDAQQSGSTTMPVIPDLSYDTAVMTLQGDVTGANGAYKATFKTKNDLGGGEYKGEIRFRLCQDAGCAVVYPGSTQVVNYTVTVQLKDWYTHQRNAAHTGYVRLTVDPAKIAKAWEYTHPFGMTKVAADKDRIYFSSYSDSSEPGHPNHAINAVNIRDGSSAWTYNLSASTVGDPAIANGAVFVMSTAGGSFSNEPLTVLKATDGAFLRRMTFGSQEAHFLAPTPVDDELYSLTGPNGNIISSYKQSDASLRWTAFGSGFNNWVWHTESPAVDNELVYFYNGDGLDAFKRSDGSRVFRIADPAAKAGGFDYDGAPVILPDRSILAYSGTTLRGFAYLEAQSARPLVRFLPDSRTIAWRSADSYRTKPAVRGDLIFVARNSPARVDALNVSDGKIAWSWTPPGNPTFRGGIVVTDNVLFVSTNENLYALNLSDRSIAWTHDAPGVFAIAPGNLLVLTEATKDEFFQSTKRLVAFRLR
jgi:outer membrane protein assembly factor BamB